MSDIKQRLRDAVKTIDSIPPSAQSMGNIRIIDAAYEAADHIAALEARNARLEEQVREAYERCAEVAEGVRYAQHYADASASAGDMQPVIYNGACNDVAQAIRTLTTEQANG